MFRSNKNLELTFFTTGPRLSQQRANKAVFVKRLVAPERRRQSRKYTGCLYHCDLAEAGGFSPKDKINKNGHGGARSGSGRKRKPSPQEVTSLPTPAAASSRSSLSSSSMFDEVATSSVDVEHFAFNDEDDDEIPLVRKRHRTDPPLPAINSDVVLPASEPASTAEVFNSQMQTGPPILWDSDEVALSSTGLESPLNNASTSANQITLETLSSSFATASSAHQISEMQMTNSDTRCQPLVAPLLQRFSDHAQPSDSHPSGFSPSLNIVIDNEDLEAHQDGDGDALKDVVLESYGDGEPEAAVGCHQNYLEGIIDRLKERSPDNQHKPMDESLRRLLKSGNLWYHPPNPVVKLRAHLLKKPFADPSVFYLPKVFLWIVDVAFPFIP